MMQAPDGSVVIAAVGRPWLWGIPKAVVMGVIYPFWLLRRLCGL
jgi:hypothetical protein